MCRWPWPSCCHVVPRLLEPTALLLRLCLLYFTCGSVLQVRTAATATLQTAVVSAEVLGVLPGSLERGLREWMLPPLEALCKKIGGKGKRDLPQVRYVTYTLWQQAVCSADAWLRLALQDPCCSCCSCCTCPVPPAVPRCVSAVSRLPRVLRSPTARGFLVTSSHLVWGAGLVGVCAVWVLHWSALHHMPTSLLLAG